MIFPFSPSACLWLLYCGCIGYELPAMIRAVRRISHVGALSEVFGEFPRWLRAFVCAYVVVCVAPLLPVHTVQRVWGWVRRLTRDRRPPAVPVAGTATGLLPVSLVRGKYATGLLAEAIFTDPGVICDPYLAMRDWFGAYIAAGKPWQPGGWLVLAEGEKEAVFYTAEEFAAHFEAVTFTNPPHDSLPD